MAHGCARTPRLLRPLRRRLVVRPVMGRPAELADAPPQQGEGLLPAVEGLGRDAGLYVTVV